MRIIGKLVWKDLASNMGRTVFTFICIALAVSVISVSLELTSVVLDRADFDGDEISESAVRNLCAFFAFVSCAMSCLAICTVFSTGIQDRLKT